MCVQVNGNEVSWTTGILFVLLPDVLDREQLPAVAAVPRDEL